MLVALVGHSLPQIFSYQMKHQYVPIPAHLLAETENKNARFNKRSVKIFILIYLRSSGKYHRRIILKISRRRKRSSGLPVMAIFEPIKNSIRAYDFKISLD